MLGARASYREIKFADSLAWIKRKRFERFEFFTDLLDQPTQRIN